MSIPLETAKTLLSRMETIELGNLASVPVFILKDLFEDMEGENATNVFNFLYQLKVKGLHPEKLIEETLTKLPIFFPFKIKPKYHCILLTPKCFSELPENRGKYGCVDIIRINYFDHTYSIRLDDKLKEVETLLEYKTIDSMGLSQTQVKICKCAQDILAGSAIKNRIRMVRYFRQDSKNNPWLAKTVYAPIRMLRLIRYNIASIKVFFIKKKNLTHAAQKLSNNRVKLYQENIKRRNTNAAIKEWAARYHEKVIDEAQAVIEALNKLGYVRKDEQWWY